MVKTHFNGGLSIQGSRDGNGNGIDAATLPGNCSQPENIVSGNPRTPLMVTANKEPD